MQTLVLKKSAILAALYTILLFAVSSLAIQSGSVLAASTASRKIIQNLLHIPAYAILAILWMRSFDYKKIALYKALIITAFVIFLFSVITEAYQVLIPERDASLGDLGLNIMGCLIGLVGFSIHKSHKRNSKQLK